MLLLLSLLLLSLLSLSISLLLLLLLLLLSLLLLLLLLLSICYYIDIVGLYKQGLGVVAKLWLLDFNYCQSNRAQWKNLRAFLGLLDTITGYLLLLLLVVLFSVVYLPIFLLINFF